MNTSIFKEATDYVQRRVNEPNAYLPSSDSDFGYLRSLISWIFQPLIQLRTLAMPLLFLPGLFDAYVEVFYSQLRLTMPSLVTFRPMEEILNREVVNFGVVASSIPVRGMSMRGSLPPWTARGHCPSLETSPMAHYLQSMHEVTYTFPSASFGFSAEGSSLPYDLMGGWKIASQSQRERRKANPLISRNISGICMPRKWIEFRRQPVNNILSVSGVSWTQLVPDKSGSTLAEGRGDAVGPAVDDLDLILSYFFPIEQFIIAEMGAAVTDGILIPIAEECPPLALVPRTYEDEFEPPSIIEAGFRPYVLVGTSSKYSFSVLRRVKYLNCIINHLGGTISANGDPLDHHHTTLIDQCPTALFYFEIVDMFLPKRLDHSHFFSGSLHCPFWPLALRADIEPGVRRSWRPLELTTGLKFDTSRYVSPGRGAFSWALRFPLLLPDEPIEPTHATRTPWLLQWFDPHHLLHQSHLTEFDPDFVFYRVFREFLKAMLQPFSGGSRHPHYPHLQLHYSISSVWWLSPILDLRILYLKVLDGLQRSTNRIYHYMHLFFGAAVPFALVVISAVVYLRWRIMLKGSFTGSTRKLSGQHDWLSVDRSSQPLYCSFCETIISGFFIFQNCGYQCSICARYAHIGCVTHGNRLKCKIPVMFDRSNLSSGPIQYMRHLVSGRPDHEEDDGVRPVTRDRCTREVQHFDMAHFPSVLKGVLGLRQQGRATNTSTEEHAWARGNLVPDSLCSVCSIVCASTFALSGLRCLWCQRTCHDGCQKTLTNHDGNYCDFGEFRDLILQPRIIVSVTPESAPSLCPSDAVEGEADHPGIAGQALGGIRDVAYSLTSKMLSPKETTNFGDGEVESLKASDEMESTVLTTPHACSPHVLPPFADSPGTIQQERDHSNDKAVAHQEVGNCRVVAHESTDRRWNLANATSFFHYEERLKSWKPDVTRLPPSASPLICFVNARSGGGLGRSVLYALKKQLNPLQVVDIHHSGEPEVSLAWFWSLIETGQCLVVCAGGDGTAAWVIQTVLRLKKRKIEGRQLSDESEADDECATLPPVCVLPIGTGNDFSRTLGWGFTLVDPMRQTEQLLKDITHNSVISKVDIWEVHAFDPITRREYKLQQAMTLSSNGGELQAFHTHEPQLFEGILHPPPGFQCAPPATFSQNLPPEDLSFGGSIMNYLDVGICARVALRFHILREKHPELFASRLANRFIYGEMGLRDYLADTTDLSGLRLWCDGQEVSLPIELAGLIVVNIPSFSGGLDAWKSKRIENSGRWSSQRIDDRIIEVVGLSSVLHCGRWQVGLADPIRIAQGHRIDIVLPPAPPVAASSQELGVPVQLDGEPKLLPYETIIQLRWKTPYPVVVNTSTTSTALTTSTTSRKKLRADSVGHVEPFQEGGPYDNQTVEPHDSNPSTVDELQWRTNRRRESRLPSWFTSVSRSSSVEKNRSSSRPSAEISRGEIHKCPSLPDLRTKGVPSSDLEGRLRAAVARGAVSTDQAIEFQKILELIKK
eukprot:GHVH01013810.1.p1 GENE.GHVH01013810.1~~GHVH01013810.1.p1  ORF type:complete len:1500 (-),score=193.75 GHVH01013810.1:79-4578(-)